MLKILWLQEIKNCLWCSSQNKPAQSCSIMKPSFSFNDEDSLLPHISVPSPPPCNMMCRRHRDIFIPGTLQGLHSRHLTDRMSPIQSLRTKADITCINAWEIITVSVHSVYTGTSGEPMVTQCTLLLWRRVPTRTVISPFSSQISPDQLSSCGKLCSVFLLISFVWNKRNYLFWHNSCWSLLPVSRDKVLV